MAERRPRLAEDIAALDEDERLQLVELLALVRGLKAAHRETPAPGGAFLQRLDGFVRKEVAQQGSPASRAHPSAAGDFRSDAVRRPGLDRILQKSRSVFDTLRDFLGGVRWRFIVGAVVVFLLGFQVLLYLQVRQLEEQNQDLVARLERFSPSGSLIPLGLPRKQGAETPAAKSLDDVFAGLELRVRIEQRIGELEKEVETKTGRDRRDAEALLRELRALLQHSSVPGGATHQ